MREKTLAVVAVVVVAWIGLEVVATAQQNPLADFFTGPPPTRIDSEEVGKARVRLVPGARAHWHSHGWGQLLLPEEGRGRFQERGGPLQELVPGVPVYSAGGVMHWHGAAPDEGLLMIAVQGGGAEWGDPVTDQEYLADPVR